MDPPRFPTCHVHVWREWELELACLFVCLQPPGGGVLRRPRRLLRSAFKPRPSTADRDLLEGISAGLRAVARHIRLSSDGLMQQQQQHGERWSADGHAEYPTRVPFRVRKNRAGRDGCDVG
ncbi:uncharacterized protein UV8b_01214 [Ustilaginoidea virens]|uniref:Uncharacterized protein n=1 Tax=Ustilaginoidea virens TaxID=1159556 RepID=A0A8E5HKH1_USTVR|nr:uncharacterized protein UV8b_01214 [Ustilaginoidea virens]QUC16973.1 hypothetical protein UV8b_01214 [Ustilaginoidea virens]